MSKEDKEDKGACGCPGAHSVHEAEALDPAALVEYAEGSVVSRTISEHSGGTLTAFAFAEGQGLSEHTAPFDAVVHVLDGEAEVTVSGKVISVRTGEIVIMPANAPHALRAVKRFKMLLTMLREGS